MPRLAPNLSLPSGQHHVPIRSVNISHFPGMRACEYRRKQFRKSAVVRHIWSTPGEVRMMDQHLAELAPSLPSPLSTTPSIAQAAEEPGSASLCNHTAGASKSEPGAWSGNMSVAHRNEDAARSSLQSENMAHGESWMFGVPAPAGWAAPRGSSLGPFRSFGDAILSRQEDCRERGLATRERERQNPSTKPLSTILLTGKCVALDLESTNTSEP